MDKKQKLLRNNAFQTVLASLICIVIGLIVGFVVLLIISPSGAGKAIIAIMKNFFYYPNAAAATKYFGTTLIKASALLMCALSVIFAYKVGLFNIGAAGQYVIGAGGCLYMALRFNLPWYICLIAGVLIAAAVGGNPEAIARVIRHYSSYIAALSMRTSYDANGFPHFQVDEDLRKRLETKLIVSILGFDLN